MNTSAKSAFIIVTLLLLATAIEVQCRRTYSSRSSSSGRGNRGKNQPSSGGLFSSWFGGSKSSSASSGAVSKPLPASAKKNWQTATGHATVQSKSPSNWGNPYYKPAGAANVPSAPKEPTYGWKPIQSSNPSANIGPRGYPVQTGAHQGSQGSFPSYKPVSAPAVSHAVPYNNQHLSQTNFGAHRPSSGLSNTHNVGQHPYGYQSGYHPASSLHSAQPSYAYQPSHHSSGSYPYQQTGAFSGYHPSSSGYSPHSNFGGPAPSYQGNKLFGGSTGHYGYPGSGSWGIDTYGSKKSSGTGKLLTGLAVGAAGGYLTSSLVNSFSNPWKYSGYGYGSRFGYGSAYGPGYDYGRSRDESAFERGFERGVQSRQQNENNKETTVAASVEDPTAKWVQCVAYDPQTQQTLINPNCSCTVTTSVDERTGQPLSVHHCTTLNGLVMRPVPTPLEQPLNPPHSLPSVTAGPGPQNTFNGAGSFSSYSGAYISDFQYNGGATVYLPPPNKTELERTVADAEQGSKEMALENTTTEANNGHSTSVRALASATSERIVEASIQKTAEEGTSQTSEKVAGGLQENRDRNSEFYGRLQKIVNMGNFVDRR